MKSPSTRWSVPVVISVVALFIALGGSAAAVVSTVGNSKRLGGKRPSFFLQYRHFAYSHGERFLNAGRTVVLGRNGHFTFTSTCSKDKGGQNQVTFDVTANTTADLDGTGPAAAGTKVNIHTNSDALDSTTSTPLKPGDFDQVASASSSTEIAADGQEADIFYNDGVNWPAGNGSKAHDCFAGYTGLIHGLPRIPGIPG
jgi:hypothetical protein